MQFESLSQGHNSANFQYELEYFRVELVWLLQFLNSGLLKEITMKLQIIKEQSSVLHHGSV